MKEIQLTQGKVALVDDADFEWLIQWNWCAKLEHGDFYVVRNGPRPMHGRIAMHREITNAQKGMVVDHINGNTLDNQRFNLRVCTQGENTRNRAMSKNNTTGFKGVIWVRERNKYAAQITVNRKCKRIGYFNDPVEAAKAYDDAAKKYHGEFANINFPTATQ